MPVTYRTVLLLAICISMCIAAIYSLPVSNTESDHQEVDTSRNRQKREDIDYWRYYGSIGKRRAPTEDEIRRLYSKAIRVKPLFTSSDEEEEYMNQLLRYLARLRTQSALAENADN